MGGDPLLPRRGRRGRDHLPALRPQGPARAPHRAPGPTHAGLAALAADPLRLPRLRPDREGDTLELEADHRRHAVVEDAIRDLKYGVGLNHMPSGRFGANAAWLGLNVMAHNLARWVSRLGLGEGLIATDTLRRRYLRTPGRMTRSARRRTLHLPERWPWRERFEESLARLRSVVLVV